MKASSPVPTVAVPVYNAFPEVSECLESLLRWKGVAPHQILLIDDGSPDERIWPLLQDFARQHPHITALRNEKNLGYTATINRACQACKGDIVLLNSDTVVTAGWLEKLAACAYSRPEVATVTPLSNAAGAFSVPVNNQANAILPEWGVDGMAALLESLSRRLRPEVPTGNGFCLYVRRAALERAGLFRTEYFPLGYGEENDFCMRASELGMVHLIDDATFVAHRRSASFGARKEIILAESKKTLRRLHSTYSGRVKRWLENDPLDDLREVLMEALAKPRSEFQKPAATRESSWSLQMDDESWILGESVGERLVPLRRFHRESPGDPEKTARQREEILAWVQSDRLPVASVAGASFVLPKASPVL